MKKIIVLLVLFLWIGIAQALPPFPTYPPQLGSDAAGRNLTIYATKGDELVPALTAANWDVVAGWSLTASTLNHNSAGAGAITPITSIAPTAGVTYKVVITLSAVTVETCSYTLGGVTGSTLSSATTYTDYITTSTTGDLIFTPLTTNSRFTISAVSIRALADGTGDLTVEGTLTVRSPVVFDGSPFQPLDATLTALAGLTIADVSVIEGTGADAFNVVASGGANRLLGSNSDNTALEFKASLTGLTFGGFTASRAVCSDASGNLVAHSTLTDTELGYVDGVTSAIQTQMDLKAPFISPSFTTPSLGAATATSLLATGIVDGRANVPISTSTPVTVGGAGLLTAYYLIQHATPATAMVFNLPVASDGQQFCFKNSQGAGGPNTGTIRIHPVTSSYMNVAGANCTVSYDVLSSANAAGDYLCVIGVDATHWEVMGYKGTFACAAPL